MIAITAKKITFAEYLTYDDGTDNRYEFVDGELVLMPPPTGKHEDIVHFVFLAFYQEILRLGLDLVPKVGNTGVRTTSKRSRFPDVVVITKEQNQSIRDVSSVLESAPLLVVEVVSSGNPENDYRYKRSEYAALGIQEYWIVDVFQHKVSILSLVDGFYEVAEFFGSDRIVSQVFPELTLTAMQVLEAGIQANGY
ncbi:Uma2 family endonuclease [Pseudanabaena sp. PCC 6802]|uniref:Uma2 family endonuclease n=1 Tax=Pseudanabaena sp. PCC 6802 TaxID=118173 RepID=UPI00034D1A30|nr:Uma2 family endonuclease [Pseudanabaena sp. PCC 6802]